MDTKATKQTEALTVVKINKVGEFDHEVVFELPNGETASYTTVWERLPEVGEVLPAEVVEQMELKKVSFIIKWKNKSYFVPQGSWGSETDVFVREAEDGTVEVSPTDFEEWNQVEESVLNVSSLTVAQWREFVKQIEDALDELTAAGKPETHRLELPLPE
jgi:hypothetical protein